jgi:hypothetical protein
VDQPMHKLAGYEILAELGRGTTGVLYVARHTVINRVSALKLPVLGSTSDVSLQVVRFHREWRVLAYLTTGESNPHLPKLYDVSEHQGQPFYVREFVEGSTLERLAMAGALTMRDGITVLAEIATAVARLHEWGHRTPEPGPGECSGRSRRHAQIDRFRCGGIPGRVEQVAPWGGGSVSGRRCPSAATAALLAERGARSASACESGGDSATRFGEESCRLRGGSRTLPWRELDELNEGGNRESWQPWRQGHGARGITNESRA